MSGIILLPGTPVTPVKGEFAKAINRVVKQFRGKSRPFVTLMVEESGEVTILSNMDHHTEKTSLILQVGEKMRSMS